MNNLKPISRKEHFMGRAAGNPGAEKLEPITREERFLEDIVEAVESGGGDLPPVSGADNGKFLRVVDGKWNKATVPEAAGEGF